MPTADLEKRNGVLCDSRIAWWRQSTLPTATVINWRSAFLSICSCIFEDAASHVPSAQPQKPNLAYCRLIQVEEGAPSTITGHLVHFLVWRSTLASTSAPVSCLAATPASTSVAIAWPTASGLVFGWRSNKGVVYRDGLVEEFCAVEGMDSCGGLGLCRIFDQDIALHVASSAVKVEMQILDVSIFGKEVCNVFFGCLFVNVCSHDDPTLDTSDCDGILCSFCFCGGCRFLGTWRCRAILVSRRLCVHFHFI